MTTGRPVVRWTGHATTGGHMSFDAEWAAHKRAVLARPSPVARLEHEAPAAHGGPDGPAGSLLVGAPSLNGNANLLVEIAALLHEGRPDGDASTMARAPRAHAEVSAQVLRFAASADERLKDTAALFAGLATRLRTTGTDFAQVDDDTAAAFLARVVDEGTYVRPEAG
ncbi:hypothetical protein ACFYUL_09890 [Streptomyces sp. NPDC004311]|uniref:hypothetical protein n=1 Tax=Streptomyces sp. NPDC004311 TaxID=3364698 RepID=UPI00369AD2E9